MIRRRRRAKLTEEDVRLWLHVTASVDPLRSRPLPPEPPLEPVPEPEPAPAPAVRHPPKPQPRKKLKVAVIAAVTPPPKPPRPPLAGIETRLRQRVSRGQMPIEARLDLHGMRQDSAHRQLFAFLVEAQRRGLKVVLVITGKGKAGPDDEVAFVERGVLRRAAPLWLAAPEARSLVLGFEEASLQHGGSGALYVRIRRLRATA